MFCDVRGCTELATHLIKIKNISFNLCEEHNKLKWTLGKTMEIYIAICNNRHANNDIKVFTRPEAAIQYAKDFILEGYVVKEQKLTNEMKKKGWIYLADYGTRGDSVRVETGILQTEKTGILQTEETLEGFTYANLTGRAVRNAMSHTAGASPRWTAIADTFAVGSTSAMKICEAYGLDPHECVRGVNCIFSCTTEKKT